MTLWLLSTAVVTIVMAILDRPRHIQDSHDWQGTTLLDVLCYIITSAAITGLIWRLVFWR